MSDVVINRKLFTARHYNFLADILKTVKLDSMGGAAALVILLMEAFALDNENFDKKRFMEAADLNFGIDYDGWESEAEAKDKTPVGNPKIIKELGCDVRGELAKFAAFGENFNYLALANWQLSNGGWSRNHVFRLLTADETRTLCGRKVDDVDKLRYAHNTNDVCQVCKEQLHTNHNEIFHHWFDRGYTT